MSPPAKLEARVSPASALLLLLLLPLFLPALVARLFCSQAQALNYRRWPCVASPSLSPFPSYPPPLCFTRLASCLCALGCVVGPSCVSHRYGPSGL